MITFLLSGLWHGASWTFVIWGALNGVYMIASLCIPQRWIEAVPMLIRTLCTFSAVCFSWTFFRANSLSDAWYIIQHMFVDLGQWNTVLQLRRAVIVGRSYDILFLLTLTLLVWVVQCIQYYGGSLRYRLDCFSRVIRIMLYYIGVASLFLVGEFAGHQFIYFQF